MPTGPLRGPLKVQGGGPLRARPLGTRPLSPGGGVEHRGPGRGPGPGARPRSAARGRGGPTTPVHLAAEVLPFFFCFAFASLNEFANRTKRKHVLNNRNREMSRNANV